MPITVEVTTESPATKPADPVAELVRATAAYARAMKKLGKVRLEVDRATAAMIEAQGKAAR